MAMKERALIIRGYTKKNKEKKKKESERICNKMRSHF